MVQHPIRPRWPAWLAQRYRYGTSAAPLARRHGPAVAPAVVSPWTAAAWTLAAAGQPALGAAAAAYSVAALAVRLSHGGAGLRVAETGVSRHLRSERRSTDPGLLSGGRRGRPGVLDQPGSIPRYPGDARGPESVGQVKT